MNSKSTGISSSMYFCVLFLLISLIMFCTEIHPCRYMAHSESTLNAKAKPYKIHQQEIRNTRASCDYSTKTAEETVFFHKLALGHSVK